MGSHLNDNRFYDLFQPKEFKKKVVDKVAIYSKMDDEYISNGVYKIEGEIFKSVWAYKEAHQKLDETDLKANGQDALSIKGALKKYFKCKPDFEGFSSILIFKETDLDSFYVKKLSSL